MSNLSPPSAGIQVDHIDHLVLTVADINTTLNFYIKVLGMREVTFGQNRKALGFGNNKFCTKRAKNMSLKLPIPLQEVLIFVSL